MNRPLRFRAWDVVDRRWASTSELALQLDGSRVWPQGTWVDYGKSSYPGRLIITQFTGLTDSKGREIYEGDIVRDTWQVNNPYGYCPEDWYDREETYEVRYIAPSFALNERCGDGGQYCVQRFRREVIGNIFEHKDLLK